MNAGSESARYNDRWERTIGGDSNDDDSTVTRSRTIVRRNRHNEVTTDFNLKCRAEDGYEAAYYSEDVQTQRYVDRREHTITINDDVGGDTSRRVFNYRRQPSPPDHSTYSNQIITSQNGDRVITSLDLWSGDPSKLLTGPSGVTYSERRRQSGPSQDEVAGEILDECFDDRINQFETPNLLVPDRSDVTFLPYTDRWERIEDGHGARDEHRIILFEGNFCSRRYYCVHADDSAIHNVKYHVEDDNETNLGIKVSDTVERSGIIDEKHQVSHIIRSNMDDLEVDNGDLCGVEERIASPLNSISNLHPERGELLTEVNVVARRTFDMDKLETSRDTVEKTCKYLDGGKTILKPSTRLDLDMNETRASPYTDRWERTEVVDDSFDNRRVIVFAHISRSSRVSDTISGIRVEDEGMIKLNDDERRNKNDNVRVNEDCLSSRESGVSNYLGSSRFLEEKKKMVQVDQSMAEVRHTSYLNFSVGSARNWGQPLLVSEVNTDFLKTVDTEVIIREDNKSFISELQLNLPSNLCSQGSMDYWSADMSSDTIMTGDSIGTFVETGDSMYTSYSSDSFVEQCETFASEMNSQDYNCANLYTNVSHLQIQDSDSLHLADIVDNKGHDFIDVYSDNDDQDAVKELQLTRTFQEDGLNYDDNNISVNISANCSSHQEGQDGSLLLLQTFNTADSNVFYSEESSSVIAEQNVASEVINNDCPPVYETPFMQEVPADTSLFLAVGGEVAVDVLRDDSDLTVGEETAVDVLRDDSVDLTVGEKTAVDLLRDDSVDLTVCGEVVAVDVLRDDSVDLAVWGEAAVDVLRDDSVDLTVGEKTAVDVLRDDSVDLTVCGEVAVDVLRDASVSLIVGEEAAVDILNDNSVDLTVGEDTAVDVIRDDSVDLTVGGEVAAVDNLGDDSVDLTVGGDATVDVLRDDSVSLIVREVTAADILRDASVSLIVGEVVAVDILRDDSVDLTVWGEAAVDVLRDDSFSLIVGEVAAVDNLRDDSVSLTVGGEVVAVDVLRDDSVDLAVWGEAAVDVLRDDSADYNVCGEVAAIDNLGDDSVDLNVEETDVDVIRDDSVDLTVGGDPTVDVLRDDSVSLIVEEVAAVDILRDDSVSLGEVVAVDILRDDSVDLTVWGEAAVDVLRDDSVDLTVGREVVEDCEGFIQVTSRRNKKKNKNKQAEMLVVKVSSDDEGSMRQYVSGSRLPTAETLNSTLSEATHLGSPTGHLCAERANAGQVEHVTFSNDRVYQGLETHMVTVNIFNDKLSEKTSVQGSNSSFDEGRVQCVWKHGEHGIIGEDQIEVIDEVEVCWKKEKPENINNVGEKENVRGKVMYSEIILKDMRRQDEEVTEQRADTEEYGTIDHHTAGDINRFVDMEDGAMNAGFTDERHSECGDVSTEITDERSFEGDDVSTDERRPSEGGDMCTEITDDRSSEDGNVNTEVTDERSSEDSDVNSYERTYEVLSTEVIYKRRGSEGMTTAVTDERKPSEGISTEVIDERRSLEVFDVSSEITDERSSEVYDVSSEITDERSSEGVNMSTYFVDERKHSEVGDVNTDTTNERSSEVYDVNTDTTNERSSEVYDVNTDTTNERSSEVYDVNTDATNERSSEVYDVSTDATNERSSEVYDVNTDTTNERSSEVYDVSTDATNERSSEVYDVNTDATNERSSEVYDVSTDATNERSSEVYDVSTDATNERSSEVYDVSTDSKNERSSEVYDVSTEVTDERSFEVYDVSTDATNERSSEVYDVNTDATNERSSEVYDVSTEVTNERSSEVYDVSTDATNERSSEVYDVSTDATNGRSSEVYDVSTEVTDERSSEVYDVSTDATNERSSEVYDVSTEVTDERSFEVCHVNTDVTDEGSSTEGGDMYTDGTDERRSCEGSDMHTDCTDERISSEGGNISTQVTDEIIFTTTGIMTTEDFDAIHPVDGDDMSIFRRWEDHQLFDGSYIGTEIIFDNKGNANSGLTSSHSGNSLFNNSSSQGEKSLPAGTLYRSESAGIEQVYLREFERPMVDLNEVHIIAQSDHTQPHDNDVPCGSNAHLCDTKYMVNTLKKIPVDTVEASTSLLSSAAMFPVDNVEASTSLLSGAAMFPVDLKVDDTKLDSKKKKKKKKRNKKGKKGKETMIDWKVMDSEDIQGSLNMKSEQTVCEGRDMSAMADILSDEVISERYDIEKLHRVEGKPLTEKSGEQNMREDEEVGRSDEKPKSEDDELNMEYEEVERSDEEPKREDDDVERSDEELRREDEVERSNEELKSEDAEERNDEELKREDAEVERNDEELKREDEEVERNAEELKREDAEVERSDEELKREDEEVERSDEEFKREKNENIERNYEPNMEDEEVERSDEVTQDEEAERRGEEPKGEDDEVERSDEVTVKEDEEVERWCEEIVRVDEEIERSVEDNVREDETERSVEETVRVEIERSGEETVRVEIVRSDEETVGVDVERSDEVNVREDEEVERWCEEIVRVDEEIERSVEENVREDEIGRSDEETVRKDETERSVEETVMEGEIERNVEETVRVGEIERSDEETVRVEIERSDEETVGVDEEIERSVEENVRVGEIERSDEENVTEEEIERSDEETVRVGEIEISVEEYVRVEIERNVEETVMEDEEVERSDEENVRVGEIERCDEETVGLDEEIEKSDEETVRVDEIERSSEEIEREDEEVEIWGEEPKREDDEVERSDEEPKREDEEVERSDEEPKREDEVERSDEDVRENEEVKRSHKEPKREDEELKREDETSFDKSKRRDEIKIDNEELNSKDDEVERIGEQTVREDEIERSGNEPKREDKGIERSDKPKREDYKVESGEQTVRIDEKIERSVEENVRQDEVIERSVDENVREDEIERSVEENVREDEVIERSVEENVRVGEIERSVEENVREDEIERSVDENVREDEIERSVEENVREDEVIERSVEENVREYEIERSVDENVSEDEVIGRSVEENVRVGEIERSVEENVRVDEIERSVDENVREDEIERSVEENVREDEVIERSVEENVRVGEIERSVEENVREDEIERSVDENVREDEIERSVEENVMEDEVIERSVEENVRVGEIERSVEENVRVDEIERSVDENVREDEIERSVDENVREDEIERSVEENVREDEVIERSVEENVRVGEIERSVEENVRVDEIERSVEENVREDEIERSVEENVRENEVIERSVEENVRVGEIERSVEENVRVDEIERSIGETVTEDEIERSGEENVRVGEMERSGEEIERVDEEIERSGEEIERVDEEIERSGEEIERVDEEIERSGEEIERVDEEMERSDEKTVKDNTNIKRGDDEGKYNNCDIAESCFKTEWMVAETSKLKVDEELILQLDSLSKIDLESVNKLAEIEQMDKDNRTVEGDVIEDYQRMNETKDLSSENDSIAFVKMYGDIENIEVEDEVLEGIICVKGAGYEGRKPSERNKTDVNDREKKLNECSLKNSEGSQSIRDEYKWTGTKEVSNDSEFLKMFTEQSENTLKEDLSVEVELDRKELFILEIPHDKMKLSRPHVFSSGGSSKECVTNIEHSEIILSSHEHFYKDNTAHGYDISFQSLDTTAEITGVSEEDSCGAHNSTASDEAKWNSDILHEASYEKYDDNVKGDVPDTNIDSFGESERGDSGEGSGTDEGFTEKGVGDDDRNVAGVDTLRVTIVDDVEVIDKKNEDNKNCSGDDTLKVMRVEDGEARNECSEENDKKCSEDGTLEVLTWKNAKQSNEWENSVNNSKEQVSSKDACSIRMDGQKQDVVGELYHLNTNKIGRMDSRDGEDLEIQFEGHYGVRTNMKTESETRTESPLDTEKSVTEASDNHAFEEIDITATFENLDVQQRDSGSEIDGAWRERLLAQLNSSVEQTRYKDSNTNEMSIAEISVKAESAKFDIETVESDINENGCLITGHNLYKNSNAKISVQQPSGSSSTFQSCSEKEHVDMRNGNIDTIHVFINADLDYNPRDSQNIFVDRQECMLSPSTDAVTRHILQDIIRNKCRAKEIVAHNPFVCQGHDAQRSTSSSEMGTLSTAGHLVSEVELLERAAQDQLTSLKVAVSEDEKYKTEILSLKAAIEENREVLEKYPVTVTSVEALKEQITLHSDTLEADSHNDSASCAIEAVEIQTENRVQQLNLWCVPQEQVQFRGNKLQALLQRQASYQQSIRDLTVEMEQLCITLAPSTFVMATPLDTQIIEHKEVQAKLSSVRSNISHVREVGQQLVHASDPEIHKTMETTLTMLVDQCNNLDIMANNRGKQLETAQQIQERQAFILKAHQKHVKEIYKFLEEKTVHKESINLALEILPNLQLQLDKNRELQEEISGHLQQIDLVCDSFLENESPVSVGQLRKELADLQSDLIQFNRTTIKKHAQLCTAIKENEIRRKERDEVDSSVEKLQKWVDDTKELSMTSGSQSTNVTVEQIYIQKELATDIKNHKQLFSQISDQRWRKTPPSPHSVVSEEEIRERWKRLHRVLDEKKNHMKTILSAENPIKLMKVSSRNALAIQGDCDRQFEEVKKMLVDVSNCWTNFQEQLQSCDVFIFHQQYQSALQNVSGWLDLAQQQLFIAPLTVEEQINQNENLQRQMGLLLREIFEISKQGVFAACRDLASQEHFEMCLGNLSEVVKLLGNCAHSQLEDLHQSERHQKQFQDEVAELQKHIEDTQKLVLVPVSEQTLEQLLSDSQKLDIWLRKCEIQLDTLKNKELNLSQSYVTDSFSLELVKVQSRFMELHRKVIEKKATLQNLVSVQDQYEKMLNDYAVFVDTAKDKLRSDSVVVRDINHLRELVTSHKDFFGDLEVHKAILNSLASQCDYITRTKFQQQHSLLINLTLDLASQSSLHGQRLESLTSQWTELNKKNIRLDKVLLAIKHKMPQPVATDDSLTTIQNKCSNYKQLLSELTAESDMLFEVVNEGKQILDNIGCPALETTVADLADRWISLKGNINHELQRAEALNDQLSVFEKEAAILSSWLYAARLKLASFLQHSPQDLQSIRTIRARRNEILEFRKEMEIQLCMKNRIVAVGTRLVQNKSSDIRAVPNRLNEFGEEWVNLENGISRAHEYLLIAEMDLMPSHQTLHELSASLEKISESFELDASKRTSSAAEIEIMVKNYKEYKIQLASMKMMLDLMNQQVLTPLTDESAVLKETFVENLRKFSNNWKKVMTDVTSRLNALEDVQTKWEEYDRAFERLQTWLCAQEDKIQKYKLVGYEVGVKNTLKELKTTLQRLHTKQTDMTSLKTLAISLIEIGHESPGCQESVVNSLSTLDHNWDGFEEQTKQLEAFLTDKLSEWSSYNTDLMSLNQILTQTEYVLSQKTLNGGDMTALKSELIKLKELQSHLKNSNARLESHSIFASQLRQVCEPIVQAGIQKNVSDIQAKWKQLSNDLAARCDQFEQSLVQWQNFEDQYSRMCDWLDYWETLCVDLMNTCDDTQKPASLSKCKKLQQDLDNRQTQITELYKTSDNLTQNMHPSAISIVTSRQSVIEERMLTLRQNLSKHMATLTDNLIMLERFNKAYDAAKDFLDSARGILASHEAVKEEDIQSRHDKIKQLLLQFNINSVKLDDVNNLGYYLAQDEVNSNRLRELNHEWQKQYEDASDMIRQLQANLLLHKDFTSKCDMWMTFLAQTEQDLAINITGNFNDLLVQLHKCEQCESEMYNQEQILHAIIDDGEKMLRAGEVEDNNFHQKLHLLSEQWQNVSVRAYQRKAIIKKQISQWQQFNIICQQLKDWLHDKEVDLKTFECDTKSLQVIISLKEKIQAIKHEIKLQETTYQRIHDLGNSLLQHADITAANRTKATILGCDQRWDKVLTSVENYWSQLERDHHQWLKCEENIEDILDWLKNIRSNLYADIPTTYDALQTDLSRCKDIAVDFSNSEDKRQCLLANEKQLGRFIQTNDMSLLHERIQLLVKQWEELQQQTYLREQILKAGLIRWSNFGEHIRKLMVWIDSMTGKIGSNRNMQVEDLLFKLTNEYKQEMEDEELKKNEIIEQGRQLMKVSNKIQVSDIEQKLLHLEDKWQHLKEVTNLRQHKLQETLMAVKQLDINMKNLNQWLEFVEKKLSQVVLFQDIGLQEIKTKFYESQELQLDIESHSAGVTAVLNLCEVLLHDSDACPTKIEFEALHLAMKTLMKRWQHICALSPRKRTRIEETWQLWKTLINDCDRFSDWMTQSEKDMREFEIDAPNLKVAKEELSKYELLQHSVIDHLNDLEHINRQYCQLIREGHAETSGCLKLRITDLNDQWDGLRLNVSKNMEKMRHPSVIKNDFETTRISLMTWLTEMNTQLTRLQCLSDLEFQSKITEFRHIEDEIITKHSRMEHLSQTAMYLIQKGNSQEATCIQHQMDDFRAFYRTVKCKVASFQQQIDQFTETEDITTAYSDGLQYFQSPAGPLRFLRGTQVTYETAEMTENPEQSLALLQRARTMKFVSDASLAHVDLSPSRQTSSPILIDGPPGHRFMEIPGSPRCDTDQSVRSMKIEALLEPLVESLGDCDTKLTQLETALESHGSTEQSMRWLMECERSVKHVQELDHLLKTETDLITIDSTDAEVKSVLQRWKNIQRWTTENKFEISQEKHDFVNFASDIDNMLIWLNEAEAMQSTHQSLPSDIAQLNVVLRQFKDFQMQLESKHVTVQTINLLSEKYLNAKTSESRQLRDKLDVMNNRWQLVFDRAINIKKDLQVSLIQCEEFHQTIHNYELWLENIDVRIRHCEPISLDGNDSLLWRKYDRLVNISGELQGNQTNVMSLKETADQLLASTESPGMLTARNKIYAVNRHMQTLTQQTSSYISALERRLQVAPNRGHSHSCSDLIKWRSTGPGSTHLSESSSSLSSTSLALRSRNITPFVVSPLHLSGIMPPMLRSTTQEKDNLTTELETAVTVLHHAKSRAVPSLLMRVIRAALPIYLLFLLFFLLFCLLPVCEDECMFSNHLRNSMSPMLLYTDGAPPT